jgi:hypothetical protein
MGALFAMNAEESNSVRSREGLAYLTGASNEDKKVKEYKNSANIVIAGVLAYNMS